eukprot:610426-Rhodomonas_salina.2
MYSSIQKIRQRFSFAAHPRTARVHPCTPSYSTCASERTIAHQERKKTSSTTLYPTRYRVAASHSIVHPVAASHSSIQ